VNEQPLYLKVKEHILANIASGAWPPGARVPSEHELVQQFSISRMTANRALKELSSDGWLNRIAGVGTFVSEPRARASLVELKDIADEIAARGHRHTMRVIASGRYAATPALAHEFETAEATALFHILVAHDENGVPVQIEDRWVNADLAPGFLDRDLAAETSTAFLLRALPVDELEHIVEAAMPAPEERRLLDIGPHEPCLVLRRRSWSRGRVATLAAFTYPASRHALYSRYRTTPAGTIEGATP
jgi:GntR family histidine utilization transcriptional repressor